ncbi:MAG: DNA-binding protein [Flavobacterium psychrophilum]|nr:MAG: DNA-binding protein [Flavobacterium psychrophilum]
MKESITKEDLWQFAAEIIREVKKITQSSNNQTDEVNNEWLKSKAVRKILDISPGTLQNIRIAGKIRFKKVLGSYYYSKSDIQKLFKD